MRSFWPPALECWGTCWSVGAGAAVAILIPLSRWLSYPFHRIPTKHIYS